MMMRYAPSLTDAPQASNTQYR
jgi:hypothetical protein